ncbi:helix-turn-helix transcriptional regulator [Bradyrhizobium sp. Arg62]|uniref:helix-turn-helix transcriptional regulator n=1 Tax=Bradyrhizobium brasilense TaxID=1419277 RepID=UPI001E4D45FD|nr:AraC family transcriptional regulator [Bradyrhizobium brasilense]MCC8943577.1 helix-turn-helix transcriptional regulator [Bradyrhizobium brasilense]
MEDSSAYGEAFGDRLRARATSFVRTLSNTNIAVTEVRADNPERGLSAPLSCEDAFLVAVMLQDYPVHEYFEDGRIAGVTSLKTGETVLYDVKRGPQFVINNSFHSVHFYFPRAALDLVADGAEAKRIDELRYQPGAGVDDAVMRGLVGSLRQAFERPEQASRLFVEHVTLAACTHAAKTYGGLRPATRPAHGGLAPWQIRRAEETLAADLEGDISLADLASDCGLSASHFSRAFRQSTGLSPHQWLLRRRVGLAKSLLSDRKLTLSEVALACGFADQSHFTRVFARLTGISPGAWRRNLD